MRGPRNWEDFDHLLGEVTDQYIASRIEPPCTPSLVAQRRYAKGIASFADQKRDRARVEIRKIVDSGEELTLREICLRAGVSRKCGQLLLKELGCSLGNGYRRKRHKRNDLWSDEEVEILLHNTNARAAVLLGGRRTRQACAGERRRLRRRGLYGTVTCTQCGTVAPRKHGGQMVCSDACREERAVECWARRGRGSERSLAEEASRLKDFLIGAMISE